MDFIERQAWLKLADYSQGTSLMAEGGQNHGLVIGLRLPPAAASLSTCIRFLRLSPEGRSRYQFCLSVNPRFWPRSITFFSARGDRCGVDRADRGANHPFDGTVFFVQLLIHARLVRTQGAATLQDENGILTGHSFFLQFLRKSQACLREPATGYGSPGIFIPSVPDD